MLVLRQLSRRQKYSQRLVPLVLSFLMILSIPAAIWLQGWQEVESVQAETVDELRQKAEELERKAKEAEAAAKQQKSVAEQAEDKKVEIASQISQVRQSIGSTDERITSTQKEIEAKNQEVAELGSELRRVETQLSAVVREMYIAKRSSGDEMTKLFANKPIGDIEREQANLAALKSASQRIYAKTNEAKAVVEKSRSDLMAQSKELENLKAQQQDQKIALADQQSVQAQLQQDAESAVVSLNEKAKQVRAQEAKVEQQISAALTAVIASRTSSPITGGQNAGQRVCRGTVVGHLGSTGNSTGPHVHFEVRLNNSAVNPRPYVSNGTLTWPVNSFTITQEFGYTDYAASGAYGGSGHTGMDLAGPYGQPVYAPACGTVILNQYYGGYGYAWAMQIDSGLVVLLGHMTGS